VFAGYGGSDAGNYDVAHRFPFGYSELVPYYEWVEATLPVQTAAMGTKESLYFTGCEAMGLPVQKTKTSLGASFRPQENAILQPHGTAGRTDERAALVYPKAQGCTFCGHCFQGCMQPPRAPRNRFAKRSTDNSYVPMALTADVWKRGGKAATLLADSFVTEVNTEERGGVPTATGVTWRVGATGEMHREDATVVVLAGGCTETPRLWFNSGLPNPNGWVGRGYTDHYLDWVIGAFDHDTGNDVGPGSAARTDLPGFGGLENVGLPPAIEAFSMAFSDSGIRGRYDNGRGFTGPWDGRTGRILGPELKDLLGGGINRLLNVLVLTDDDVEPDNRVMPSAYPADEHGPVAKVQFLHRRRSTRTVRNREFLTRRAVELLRGAGARKVYRMDWAPVPLHVQSSMRMGASEHDSVTTESGETRWVQRLFIADNSALPNAVGGANPTLTTQALATRTAENLYRRYFGGDPWVRAESPTESTDSRISARLAQLGL
jgi:choline dehydrogenase-like flavoprotein